MPGPMPPARRSSRGYSYVLDSPTMGSRRRILGCAFRPYEAAHARWRQTEALFASKAPKAASLLRRAHQATVQLGERPLRHEIERLAQRTRIDLQPPSIGGK